MDQPIKEHPNIVKLYLIPYIVLLSLYFLIIGGGASWLYLSAREAQTELMTTHMLNVIKPTIQQLESEQGKLRQNYQLADLSDKIVHLYRLLPHLREISLRDNQQGHGIHLAPNGTLITVPLDSLAPDNLVQFDQQTLIHQVHHTDTQFLHLYFYLNLANKLPVQVDLAFDRLGLVFQIEKSMQTLIHNIIIFSSLAISSLIFALGLSLYIGKSSLRLGERLQIIYQQAALGKLAAALVHDLRNPLASIKANIKNLLITPEQTPEIVTEMDQDLLRLERKLSDFLKLTKPQVATFSTLNVQQFIADSVQQCSALFKEKRQTVNIDIADNAPTTIMAQPEALSDAMVNLLINARDHAPEQGQIDLHIRALDTQIEIKLEDNGPGIPEKLLPHILEPFFTTRADGHGLGLAIAQRNIQAHNGTLSVQNRPEGGACFVITLPIKQHGQQTYE